MVMELMENDLHNIIFKRNIKLSREKKIYIILDVINGVICLKNNHIVHCDIKCRNVLVDSKGKAKLCDLGISKKLALNNETVKT